LKAASGGDGPFLFLFFFRTSPGFRAGQEVQSSGQQTKTRPPCLSFSLFFFFLQSLFLLWPQAGKPKDYSATSSGTRLSFFFFPLFLFFVISSRSVVQTTAARSAQGSFLSFFFPFFFPFSGWWRSVAGSSRIWLVGGGPGTFFPSPLFFFSFFRRGRKHMQERRRQTRQKRAPRISHPLLFFPFSFFFWEAGGIGAWE